MIDSSFPEQVHALLIRYRKQASDILDGNMEALVVYGSLARGDYLPGRSNINVLCVPRECSLQALAHCGSIHRRWGKEGIIAPLVLTRNELTQFSHRFPLECWDMKEQHVVLEGCDPFSDLHVDDTHLMFQCEQELIGNLIRVRQRYVEGLARPEAIAALLPISLNSLLACFRGLFRVLGYPASGPTTVLLNRLSETLGIEAKAFDEVWQMKRGLSSPGALELPRLLERYLHGLEQAIARFDELKTEGRR
ncbi:MAG: hypothetical protein D6690_12260 [Nitrospirae bacterium]|nr:MAG: hypothetical protein D6690_12260 [Nitrospirota bacterium]